MCDSATAALLEFEPESWLFTLPAWQVADIATLRQQGKSYDEILDEFLAVSTATGTVPFGGGSAYGIFRDKWTEEAYKFFCSPNHYQEERAEWVRQANVSKTSAAGMMSATFAEVFTAAPAYIGPAVAVTLLTIGTMTLNAFCATLAQRQSERQESSEEDVQD